MHPTNESGRRLLWLTDAYYPSHGGMARSCDRIVSGLRRSGFVLDLVHLSRHATRDRCEHKLGGRDLRCALGDDPAHATNRLWSMHHSRWRERNYHGVVAFGGVHAIGAAPIFSAWLGVPLVTLLRGNDFDASLFSRHRGALFDALERSAWVGAVTREKVEKVARLFPHQRVEWTPNGIDVESWRRREAADVDTLPLGSVASGKRRIGIFGQLKAKKGVGFFLEAWASSAAREAFELALVGDRTPDLTALLAEHQNLEVVTADFVDHADLPRLYASCDAVAIPSFYDGMPNVMLEAMALGVPVLASDVGGMADVIVDGKTGFLFFPGDPHDLRRTLQRFVETPRDALQALGLAARQQVECELTAERELERYRQLFLHPLHSRPFDARLVTASRAAVCQ